MFKCIHQIACYEKLVAISTSCRAIDHTRKQLLSYVMENTGPYFSIHLSEIACQPTHKQFFTIPRKRTNCIFTPNIKSRIISMKSTSSFTTQFKLHTPMKIRTPLALSKNNSVKGTPSSASSVASQCRCYVFTRAKSKYELRPEKLEIPNVVAKNSIKAAISYLHSLGKFYAFLRGAQFSNELEMNQKSYLSLPDTSTKKEKKAKARNVYDTPKLNYRRIEEKAYREYKEKSNKCMDEAMSTICKHLDEAFQISKERRGNIVSSISVSHTSIDLLHVVEEEEHLE